MLQVLVTSIPSGAIIALVALAFAFRYRVFAFIDMSLPVLFVIAPYAAHVCIHRIGLALGIACIAGIAVSCLLAVFLELALWKNLRKRAPATVLLLTSLGLYTAMMAVLSLAFGHDIRSLLNSGPRPTVRLCAVAVTDVQILIVVCVAAIISSLSWAHNHTRFGAQYRAMANSNELARVSGIPTTAREMLVTIVSALLLAIAGILNALDLDLDLTSGFQPFLWGIVAAIVGGFRSLLGIAACSLVLVAGLFACGWYAGTKWEDSILLVGLVLTALLIPRPDLHSGGKGDKE